MKIIFDGGWGGLPINMSVMRYRKGSTTTILNFPKSAEQANIVFKADDINSNSVENKYKYQCTVQVLYHCTNFITEYQR